jgi:D-alanyl-lipoteichoic acid acyltransferase DltB (MBOAT superfamily)
LGVRFAVIFVSWEFVTFFVVVAAAYFCLPLRLRWVWLLGASLFFYASAGPLFLIKIVAATAVTYAIALQLEKATGSTRRQLLMGAGVGLLVLNLFVFKYASFLNESTRTLLAAFNIDYAAPSFQLLLPLGISFYTFQLIGYLIDVSRGEKAERNFGHFALFVTFFPKLVAGPIERARGLLPQIKADHPLSPENLSEGLKLIAWGAFKKVVVADRLAPIVNSVYDAPQAYDGVSLMFATWLYAFQLYCDFSGYTDMALGTARVLGFKLTQNFNRPYFATSIQDFWKRWHISLTSWLTDYVFNPLIKSKFVKMKWYNLMLISMFATFLISGFWHGAQWTFVAWGALHGLYIVIALMLQKPWNQFAANVGLTKRPQLYRSGKIVFTFILVCFAYILFRANTMNDALYIITHLHTGLGDPVEGLKATVGLLREEFVIGMLGVAVVMGVDVLKGRIDVGAMLAARPAWMRWGLYYAGATTIVILGAYYNVSREFIYFHF